MCPISMTGVPLVFANRKRDAAHSRTCVMLPGLLSTSSVAIVCIESIISISGDKSSVYSNILCREVSQRMLILSRLSLLFEPCRLSKRSARILSWCALSSPLTYSIFLSCMFRMVCSVRVLLPIPGSPPNNTILPATSPPPRTRLSSASCMSIRGSSWVGMSRNLTGRFLSDVDLSL